MTDPSRILNPDSYVHINSADVPLRTSVSVEGQARPGLGELMLRTLMIGNDVMMLDARRKKGQIDPEHTHDDHEAVGYLISGKMRLVIDGKEFIATPGSVWHHARGVPHWTEALEDSHQIEVKTPPRKTWVTKP